MGHSGNLNSKSFTDTLEPSTPHLNNVKDKVSNQPSFPLIPPSPVTEFTLLTLYNIEVRFSSQFTLKSTQKNELEKQLDPKLESYYMHRK